MDIETILNTYGCSSVGELSAGSAIPYYGEGIEVIHEPLARDPGIVTVIIRTQGSRNESLEETFLCLAAQVDQRFSVCLVCHNVDSEDIVGVMRVVDGLPVALKERVTVIGTSGGGRSRPLNAGLRHVKTSYFTILDDDDLVFDNWIGAFIEGIESHSGRIIHSNVFTQEWERVVTADGVVLRATGSPVPAFCGDYDYLEQLSLNKCPTMGLAYPSFLYSYFGFAFDESLTTLEDWDFLMRSVQKCGVWDTGIDVAIYRLWSNNGSSHSLHDQQEWEENRQCVIRRLKSDYLVFPPGTASDSWYTAGVNQPVEMPAELPRLALLDHGIFQCELKCDHFSYNPSSFINSIIFSVNDVSADFLSLVLRPKGLYTISDFSFEVSYSDGFKSQFGLYDATVLGISKRSNEMSFIRSGSFIQIRLPRGSAPISSCSVKLKYFDYIDENILAGTKIVLRAKNKARRIRYKLLKKLGMIKSGIEVDR